MEKNVNNNKKKYLPPTVEMIQLSIEKGFAGSGADPASPSPGGSNAPEAYELESW